MVKSGGSGKTCQRNDDWVREQQNQILQQQLKVKQAPSRSSNRLLSLGEMIANLDQVGEIKLLDKGTGKVSTQTVCESGSKELEELRQEFEKLKAENRTMKEAEKNARFNIEHFKNIDDDICRVSSAKLLAKNRKIGMKMLKNRKQ